MAQSTWDTAAEVAFLTNLGTGTHTEPGCRAVHGISRRTLLHRYMRAMSLRHEWHGMQRSTIERAVWRMILTEETQQAPGRS